jgi:hypothetical protein
VVEESEEEEKEEEKKMEEMGPSTRGAALPRTQLEGSAGSSSSWPDIGDAELGGASLPFRDAVNPDAEPIFILNDRDEVHRWEYLEGVRRHLDRLLQVASEAVSRSMRDATEV